MVKFDSAIFQKTSVQIERRSVFWKVIFDLPNEVKERLPLFETQHFYGELVMGFYTDPIPSDIITYRGHVWRVVERQFTPNRYKSKDKRVVPILIVEYLRELPIED